MASEVKSGTVPEPLHPGTRWAPLELGIVYEDTLVIVPLRACTLRAVME